MKRNKKSGLEFLADKIDRDIEKEIEAIEKRDVEIPAEYYEQMHPFIYKLNQELEQKKKKQIRQRWLRMAAVFTVAFISLNAAAIGTSEAYREKVFSLFHDEEHGGVTFVFDVEGEMVEEWEGYWVPTWIPEGFDLYATEKNDIGYFMMFQANPEEIIRVIEYLPGAQVAFDTDTTEMEPTSISGNDGYLLLDEEHKKGNLLWNIDGSLIVIEIQGVQITKENMLKIAESMEYIE